MNAVDTAGPVTLSGALDQWAAVTPDSPFLVTPERVWTYRQAADAGRGLAAGLRSLGVGPGDRVAIAAPNSAEWLITLMATSRLGATLVALNVLYREHELEVMLNGSGAVMLICPDRHRDFDFASFLDGFRPRLRTVLEYVFLGGPGFAGSRQWADLAAATEVAPALPPAPSAPAVILYTSGTTGQPKGAVLTHAGILASARAQARHLGYQADDVIIGHMPINHVGGLTCSVVAAMVVGARVVLLPGFSPSDALDALTRRRVTVFIGVPTMYTKMMAHDGFADADLSRVRTCVIGGSNVEPAFARRISAAFPAARLANLYGLSETSGACVISASSDGLDVLAETLGVPIAGVEARVIDGEGRPVAAGQDGELQIRGACVAAGYWERPDDTRTVFGSDGWLSTGDMALIRPDSRIALRGRRKEMYVRGGYNVYPAEIENVLASHPDVAMSAVVGVADDTYGEVGVAFVVPAPGRSIDTEELRRLCGAQLARYKEPAEIRVVSALPVTATGKLNKHELRHILHQS